MHRAQNKTLEIQYFTTGKKDLKKKKIPLNLTQRTLIKAVQIRINDTSDTRPPLVA